MPRNLYPQRATFLLFLQSTAQNFVLYLTLSGFLLALMSFHVSDSQIVSLHFKDAPLQKVFEEIRKQIGYSFAYSDADLEKGKPVSIDLSQTQVKDALSIIFRDQPFTFLIIEKVVVIKLISEKKTVNLTTSTLYQLIDVRGRVLNEREDPIAGVSVQIKGSRGGTTTNGEGEFSLKNVEATATLMLTGVNIETKEVDISGQRNLELRVKGKTSKLDEVQVIAYGKTSQRFNVGNVFSVKAEDIERQPVSNPLLALQGRVPGLFVTQETGMNGGGIKIRVQGENSIRNGNNPLIVVDGIPYPSELPEFNFSASLLGNNGKGSPLSFININDIESIDVLKDADATSIYGSKAANGAILITTKKGKSGQMRFNANLQQGWSKVSNRLEMMNTKQYLDMRYEAFRNSGQIPTDKTTLFSPYQFAPDLTVWDTTRYTNWQKELIGETAQFANYNISVSGGSSNTSYLVGVTFNRQTDVYPGDHSLKSGGLHFNINSSTIDQKFKIQLTGTYTSNDNDLPGIDLTADAIRTVPVAPPLFSGSELNWALNTSGVETWANPLAGSKYNIFNQNARTLFSSLFLSYSLLPGLELRGQFGYNQVQTNAFRKILLESYRPSIRNNSTRFATFQNNFVSNLSVEPQLYFDSRYGDLRLNALIGASFQQNNTEFSNISGSGYLSDLQMNGVAGAASIATVMDKTIYKYNGLFSRIGAIWKEQIIFNLNIRRDGSSRFGDERRFHNFGSIAAGWIFSDNNLIKRRLPWLTFGKLRISYGTTGNDQVGDYSFLSTNISFTPNILYQGVTILHPSKLYNPYLQWEETKKLQGGIDIGLWNDRILLNVTYARNRCSNQLIDYVLPQITGFNSVNANLAAILQNTSWEFSLNSINLKSKHFSWNSSVNVTIPRNKVVKFPDIEKTPYASPALGIVVGQPRGVIPVGIYLGMDPAIGKYQSADSAGNPQLLINYFPKYLSLAPIYYGGMQHTIRYKNFQLDFLLMFVRQWGTRAQEFYNGEQPPGTALRARGNQTIQTLTRWQKPGDEAEREPYLSNAGTPNAVIMNSDAFYSLDASYIRFKNASFSWQVPAHLIKKIGLQSGRVYTQGQNLFTITQFTGLDPENQSLTSLPPLRTWTIGIQLSL